MARVSFEGFMTCLERDILSSKGELVFTKKYNRTSPAFSAALPVRIVAGNSGLALASVVRGKIKPESSAQCTLIMGDGRVLDGGARAKIPPLLRLVKAYILTPETDKYCRLINLKF